MIWTEYLTTYSAWLRSLGKANATVIAYAKDVQQFLEYLTRLGKTDPKQVVSEDFQNYQNELVTLRYTDKSISRKLNSLKSFFRYLKNENIVAENPIQTINHPKYEVAPPRVLSRLEYRALRDVCKTDVRMSAIIELLLQTGLRISELAALRVGDIGLNKKEMYIIAQNSHPDRIVPLNKSAIAAINEYSKVRPRASEPTFFLTKSCRPFLVRNIRSAVDRYFRLAGIKDAKVNDLRHTFIVEQLSAGVPLVNVSQIVGHKRLSTTERYLQLIDMKTLNANIVIREL